MNLKNIAEKDLRELFATLHEEYLVASKGRITSTFAEIRYVRIRDELMEVIEEMQNRRLARGQNSLAFSEESSYFTAKAKRLENE